MQLRPYQQTAISDLYSWFHANKSPEKHPCLVLPTGAGKSVIIASLVRDALTNWPETRVLMLTHQKELIEQNAEKLQSLWPTAPLGVCSASLNRKVFHRPITYAGIQSIHKHAEKLGHIDLVIIDECHLINHSESGNYRRFLLALKTINPNIRYIGLTATPWRLGHGKITDGDDALFSDLIEPVSITDLIANGFLARLESKATSFKIDVSGVKKSGGEFIEKHLQAATGTDLVVESIVSEVLPRATDLRSMLWFCTGVDNAKHYVDSLRAKGEEAHCVTGETSRKLRAELLAAFKAQEFRHITNANVLTTGFDAPNIDGIVMARPTMSPVLYVQMVGRGLRLKDHTDHCKIFDFAGNVRQHGPITDVNPPKKAGGGIAPTKECPVCQEIVLAFSKECPSCGHKFVPDEAEKEKQIPSLHSDDIMGLEPIEIMVKSVVWSVHTSRRTGKKMLKAKYLNSDMLGDNVEEYFCLFDESDFVRKKAAKSISGFFSVKSYSDFLFKNPVEEPKSGHWSDLYFSSDKASEQELFADNYASIMKLTPCPSSIKAQRRGKFYNVTERIFK